MARVALLVVAVLVAAAIELPAQQRSRSVAVSFHGFRVATPRQAFRDAVRLAAGTAPCRRSSDPRITDCRGTAPMPGQAKPWELRASLVHDSTAIILLSGSIAPEQIATWLADLERLHGAPEVRRSGPAETRTYQWVRNRQMLRVTVRPGIGDPVVAVSLVDGPLLDGLDRPAAPAGARP